MGVTPFKYLMFPNTHGLLEKIKSITFAWPLFFFADHLYFIFCIASELHGAIY